MPIDPAHIAKAAAALAVARRTQTRIGLPPEADRPRSIADAYAVQDAATTELGAVVGGFKASLLPSGGLTPAQTTDAAGSIATGVRAPMYASTIYTSPARFPTTESPQCGVEGEVAFRFRRDLSPRTTPYTREEVAAVVDACAAIEVVTSRYAEPDTASFLDKLADCVSNGGFVYGAAIGNWHRLDLGKLKVTLTVNGTTVLDQVGGHPTGDPLGIAVAFVEMMRTTGGVKAGQFVTCGSCTGLRYLKPGDTCRVEFEGLGSAEVTFCDLT
jgi:2-keto-4-pentenoate hydratase